MPKVVPFLLAKNISAFFFCLSVFFIVFFIYTAIRWASGKYEVPEKPEDLVLPTVDNLNKTADQVESFRKQYTNLKEFLNRVSGKNEEDKDG